MDMDEVISAITVADLKSFSKAANQLYLSQSAVSLRVRKLEEELGIKIFERNTRTVTITEAGEVFYAYAEPMVRAWEKLTEEMDKFKSQNASRLNVGLIPTARDRGILRHVLDFIQQTDCIDISLSSSTAKELLDKIYDGTIDVAILPLSPKMKYQERPKIQYCYLYKEDTQLLVSEHSPYVKFDKVTLQDVERMPFIEFQSKELSTTEKQRLQEIYGISPHIVLRTNNLESTYEAVSQGIGVRLDPESIGENYSIRTIPLDPPITESYIHLIYLDRRATDSDIVMFRDFILKHYRRPVGGKHPNAPTFG